MVTFEHKGSIKNRLTGIIMLVTFFTGTIGYGSFVYWYMNDQQSRSLHLAKTVGLVLGQDVAKLVLLNKISAAADITSKLKSFPDLNTMVLHKLDGEAIFQYSKDNSSFTVTPLPLPSQREFKITGNTIKLYIDAQYQDTPLGYIQLNIQVVTIWDVIQQNIKTLVLILLLMFFLSYLMALVFSRRFTQPILNLVSFLEKIDLIDSLKQRISTKEDNEFGKLYAEVNTMLERMESSQQAQKIAATAFETQSGMTITNADQKILQVNNAFTNITGYTSEDVIGKTPAVLNSGRHDETFYKKMYASLEKYHYWSGEIYNRHKDGTVFPEYLTIQAVLDNHEKTIYYVASFIDLTFQKEAEEKVAYLTQYDSLTGLPNKELLLKNIQQYLDESRQKGWGALVCFDIQDFKMINDAYGHSSGDMLLEQIASRVKNHFKISDLIGRIAGDEFAIWFNFLDTDKEKASMQCETFVQDLLTILRQAFTLNDQTIHPILYAGIALYDENNTDADELLKQADGALHLAKKKQDKNLAFFDEDAEKMLLTHFHIHSELLSAVEEEQFELYYQLQYNSQHQVYGAEALIRWNHPEKNIVSPDNFISIAEKTGLILPIGLWIVETACKQLTLWQKDPKTSHWVLAINISAKQFNQKEFVPQIEEIMNKYTIEMGRLKFELTESILVDNIDTVIKKMEQLQRLGVQISLDDFGTGYSSLQYLKSLPIDQVKIDQSFIKGMHTHRIDIAIIKSVLLLAEALQIEVIAEGVETKEHYELLKELGCTLFQGYYFSRPQKINAIEYTKQVSLLQER